MTRRCPVRCGKWRSGLGGLDRCANMMRLTLVEKRQPLPRKRMLKSGKILLGKHPVPCTIWNMSERGACLKVQTTIGIPKVFDFLRAGEPAARKCKAIWRDGTQIGVMFIQPE
jgi:hypothetical protein